MPTNHTSDCLVDPTGPLTMGTIPDEDLDRMIAATVPAGTKACARWCDMGRSGYQHDDYSPHCEAQVAGVDGHDTAAGHAAELWASAVSNLPHVEARHSRGVQVSHLTYDGQQWAERNVVISSEAARSLAAALIAAADIVAEHPLDRFTTAHILGEMRTALVAADPAALTREDRVALLDLLERASSKALRLGRV